ncbi:uncharacterized protein LOC117109301 [Anneissia japonica]|uniref:uncharacterized protein LOC117109301 n=1 Tax=Anneissia japonica TaxID=1529436 RepID=UPI00142562AB|nr:uncharacterized protein LOC117109301 [Anneissia japonica]
MLDCKLSEDGSLLVFMLLFPDCRPKDAHISFVFIDVNEMKVRPYRINVHYSLSQLEFTRCLDKGTCSFQISRTFNITGAAYLLVKVLDFQHVYSIESGGLVMQTSELPTSGLTINPKHLTLNDQSMINLACTQGRMIIINYGNKQPLVKLVDISDNNTEENKKSVYASHKAWKKNTAPSNTWLWSKRDLLDGQDNRHVAIYFRRVVLQLADIAIQMSDGVFEDDVRKEYEKQDRLNPFALKNEEPTADEEDSKDENNQTADQQDLEQGPSTSDEPNGRTSQNE